MAATRHPAVRGFYTTRPCWHSAAALPLRHQKYICEHHIWLCFSNSPWTFAVSGVGCISPGGVPLKAVKEADNRVRLKGFTEKTQSSLQLDGLNSNRIRRYQLQVPNTEFLLANRSRMHQIHLLPKCVSSSRWPPTVSGTQATKGVGY